MLTRAFALSVARSLRQPLVAGKFPAIKRRSNLAPTCASDQIPALPSSRSHENGFVDYSGVQPHIIDPNTGEKIDVELFVAVLGASSLTFSVATLTQRVEDFASAHVKAFEYFGGAPADFAFRDHSFRRDEITAISGRFGAM